MTTCPKCNYVRQPGDPEPDYECPRCGVVYSKVRPIQEGAPPETRDTSARPLPGERVHRPASVQIETYPVPARWIDDRQNKILLLSIAVSLAIGYFAGREHLKYELRTAFEGAAQGFRRALGGEAPPPPKASKPASKLEQPIAPLLKQKGFDEGQYGQDTITLKIDFSNRTGRDIRAFDGNLIFTDLLDNQILSAKVAINEFVPAGGTYAWSGGISYNQFIDNHERLRGAEIQNMKVVLSTNKVLFADGEVKEYGQ